jgi:flagellar protein FliS
MTSIGQDAYLRDAVLTATPEQLQLMLYDGAIRFATQAREAIQAQDIENSYNLLVKAEAIVLEMQKGLNREVAPGLTEQMSRLYAYIYRRLVEANINKDLQALDDALRILTYQRETWALLVDRVRQERSGQNQTPETVASSTSSAAPQTPEKRGGLCLEG